MTWPLGIPFDRWLWVKGDIPGADKLSASSSRSRPVGSGPGADTADARRDCDAGSEITRSDTQRQYDSFYSKRNGLLTDLRTGEISDILRAHLQPKFEDSFRHNMSQNLESKL